MNLKIILCIAIGYIFGNFQSAYILVKKMYKEDIRLVGSNNAGTMNVYLNYGAETALIVLLLDMMKTVLAGIVCSVFFKSIGSVNALSLACLGASLGHEFPFWLSFKGGKGVACAVAFTLCLDIKIFAVSIICAAVFALFTRSLKYGSYTFAMFMFISCVVFGYSLIPSLCALIQSGLICALHVKTRTVKNHPA